MKQKWPCPRVYLYILDTERNIFEISVNMGIKTKKNQSFIYRLPNVSLILDDL